MRCPFPINCLCSTCKGDLVLHAHSGGNLPEPGKCAYNPKMMLDKYARDFKLWRDWASINFTASKTLFDTGDPFLMFPAATLGHHALETYLKSALITKGLTIFNPNKLKELDPGINLAKERCAWGHNLVKLAKQLEQRTPAFDLAKALPPIGFLTIQEPMTLERGLLEFDPFFTELRYPQQMDKIDGIGFEHRHLLEILVKELRHARFEWNQSQHTS
jgi:hypothetical protein